MTRTSVTTGHNPRIATTLAACLLAAGGCVADDTLQTSADTEALTGSDVGPPVIPALQYLAELPAEPHGETALARLFAQGTADHVPVGDGTGYPVLFNTVPELNWFASQLWGGKTFRIVAEGTHPNGDPIVALDNKIIKTPAGALFDLFDAYVTRGTIADLALGVNDRGEVVAPPRGTLPTAAVSFLDESVVIDDRPAVILNYFEDRSLPIIRRILDEIREVDPQGCPGVYLGRAHVRRCTSFACGELPTAIVDFPTKLTFDTRYEWSFWTYFLLNFGQPEGSTCDLAPVIARVEQELGIDLPAAPPAQ